MKFAHSLPLLTLTLLALSNCASKPPIDFSQAAYWSRSNVLDTTYINGIAAQKRLNRDIAACVSTIKSAQTPNKLRRALPADAPANIAQERRHLANWDSPERDRYLHTEHTMYQTFEQCMQHKGWSRTYNLPFEDTLRAQGTYVSRQAQAYQRAPKPKGFWNNLFGSDDTDQNYEQSSGRIKSLDNSLINF